MLTDAQLNKLATDLHDLKVTDDGSVILFSQDDEGHATFLRLTASEVNALPRKPGSELVKHYIQVSVGATGQLLTYWSAHERAVGDVVNVPIIFTNGHEVTIVGTIETLGKGLYEGEIRQIIED